MDEEHHALGAITGVTIGLTVGTSAAEFVGWPLVENPRPFFPPAVNNAPIDIVIGQPVECASSRFCDLGEIPVVRPPTLGDGIISAAPSPGVLSARGQSTCQRHETVRAGGVQAARPPRPPRSPGPVAFGIGALNHPHADTLDTGVLERPHPLAVVACSPGASASERVSIRSPL